MCSRRQEFVNKQVVTNSKFLEKDKELSETNKAIITQLGKGKQDAGANSSKKE